MISRAWLENITLKFKNPARTSRNTLTEKVSYFILLQDSHGKIGIGECSPIFGLSPETPQGLETKLSEIIYLLNHKYDPLEIRLPDFPSIQFALEVGALDLKNGGKRTIFPGEFDKGKMSVPINGLVWMHHPNGMRKQIEEKINQGFTCIKLKIGGNSFNEELNLLDEIRSHFGNSIELRLDANGAFSSEEALGKIERLSKFNIHSIEQPIGTGHHEKMAVLCEASPIPIALDEELIGMEIEQAELLFEIVKPDYIVLKPTLLGGFADCDRLIELANECNIGWWATSYLESNIGLNAIAQWVASKQVSIHHGLGTGSLFENNIESPLKVENGMISSDPDLNWDVEVVLQNA